MHQVEYKSEADVLEVIVLNCPVLHGDVKLRFQCSSVSLVSYWIVKLNISLYVIPQTYEDW